MKILLYFLDEVVNVYNINVTVTTANSPIAGQPLSLQCSAAGLGGVTSRADVTWRVNNVDLQTITGIPSFILSSYQVPYVIPQLSTTDDGKVYQCEVVINTSLPVMATGSVILDVTGTHCKLRLKT